MGEIADMMLDGTLCEGCGSYIDDSGGDGIPRYCSKECARGRGAELVCDAPAPVAKSRSRARNRGPHPCPQKCGFSFVTARAAEQHARDKHGVGG